MRSTSRVSTTLFAFSFLACINALPTPQGQGETPPFIPSFQIPRPDAQLDGTYPPNPPDSSGSPLGGKGLIGLGGAEGSYSPGGNIPSSEVQLAPGQTANEDLGFYFDWSKIALPQPIRGETDTPTDPGPRTLLHYTAVVLHGSSTIRSPY